MRYLPLVILLGACGGGSDPEPLVSSSLTASYAGTTFTPVNGFATIYMDSPIVVVGDGTIHCGSESSKSPPPGRTAVFEIDSFDVGVHSSFTQMFTNVGDFMGIGSSDGTVTITASTETSVAGMLAYDYTSADDGKMYSVAGAFEAIRCP